MSQEKYIGMDVHQATISVAVMAAWLHDLLSANALIATVIQERTFRAVYL